MDSARYDFSSNPAFTYKGLFKVPWATEADTADGQLLDMVILMSPTEHTHLWNVEVKIPQAGNFQCKCLMKGDIRPSSDILCRPGGGRQSRIFLARHSWIRSHTRRPPASWMEEIWHPLRPFISALGRVKVKIFTEGKNKAFLKAADSRTTFSERDLPVEEPWLLQFSLLTHNVAESNASSGYNIVECLTNGTLGLKSLNQSTLSTSEDMVTVVNESPDTSKTLRESDYPIEEPWLIQSSLPFPTPNAKVPCDEPNNEGPVNVEAAHVEFHDQHQHISEKLLLDGESTEVSQEDSVSTVILINSSICTVQRIAVLEDGKLVELLLEPVKNNVQCDSVYLGVVTKLVPHMGGAFVNIGSPRSSLMDIKPNREPFIFPPFRHHTKEREEDAAVSGKPREHPGATENEYSSDDAELIDESEEHEFEDDVVQYIHDEFEEDEIEDDFDVTEALKERVNGSVVRHRMETNFERDLDQLNGNVYHPENQSINKFLPVEIGCSDDLEPTYLKDMKDRRDASTDESKWSQVQKGTKIIVQVVKEGLGTKGPTLTAYPKLKSRFWILIARCKTIGISKKISGVERTRLRVIAKTLQPQGFGLTVRTVAAGHSLEELQKDLEALLSTWKVIMEHAKSAALAADEGVEGAIPVLLHRAMGQTLSIVQDYFSDKVKSMVVDSPRTYHEVTNYLQEIAPDLCNRVELYSKRTPLFDEYNIEEEINGILGKRVPLANGGYLVIEQTEALVSIDVNGGHCMLGQGNSQEKAILDVNLAAAKQIARELRLRDIGGIIVVDFIDMLDDSNKRLVYEEVKRTVERDRSTVKVSELSRHGLMEITRKRVRPSVTFMISEPCTCCHATGRVEALDTSFSKIEHEICRLLAMRDLKADPGKPKLWPKFMLRVDRYMCNYLTSGKRTRLAVLSSSLKVWILLKVARGFTRGAFELKPLTEDKDYNNQHQVAIPMLRRADVGTYSPSRKVTIFPIKKWKTGGK